MSGPNLSLSGNPRYQPRSLQDIFGYDNLYRPVAEIEIATLRTLAEIGAMPKGDIALLTSEIEQELLAITTTKVDEVERLVTKHDIRAWIRIAQEKMDPRLRRWVHIPLTSYDVLDSARSLQFVRAHQVVRSRTRELMGHLAEHIYSQAEQRQIGRTHGQHALPITVGFWFATVLSRILVNIRAADETAANLVGKISGAVGAYNAQVGLGIAELSGDDPFENRVLRKIGLEPAKISTQILPPEPLAYHLFAYVSLSAALAQFGLDARHLMRTEIGEIGEPFDKGQVGSSTMAHKRNPMTFEGIEGAGRKNKAEFYKVLDTLTSEHQRDLVGSSIARDFPTIVVNLVYQLDRLLQKKGDGPPFIARITVDTEACERNFAVQGDLILAEPIYVALQMAGYEGDAHELVNHKAIARSRETKRPLIDSVREILTAEEPDVVDRVFAGISEKTLELLGRPEDYIGAAVTKAVAVAYEADRYLQWE